MVDAALIQQCVDPGLKPGIAEKFIAEAGASDPLAVTVRSGDRVILVPRAKTADDAMGLIAEYVGQAVVRVGITQYPAGLGMKDVSDLKPDLVDPCKNIRMGTALFGKVYRIVTKWYGSPAEEAFDDAIISWQSGYFEGKAVFTANDPGPMKLAEPNIDGTENSANSEKVPPGLAAPNNADMRIDLSGIGVTSR